MYFSNTHTHIYIYNNLVSPYTVSVKSDSLPGARHCTAASYSYTVRRTRAKTTIVIVNDSVVGTCVRAGVAESPKYSEIVPSDSLEYNMTRMARLNTS